MAPVPSLNTEAGDFALPDSAGKPVRLADYRGRNVVLAFYPADWSPVCSSELVLIQETLGEIRALNAEVLGVSVDNAWSHRAWADKLHLQFPLLADFWPHGELARAYGVFREDRGTARRSLFFIDQAGCLRDFWLADDSGAAPGLNIIFEALKRLNGGGHA